MTPFIDDSFSTVRPLAPFSDLEADMALEHLLDKRAQLRELGVWPDPACYDFACCFQSPGPTAPCRWVDVVRGRDAVDIYIHLPFCRARCSFCYFVIATNPKILAAAYWTHLRREISLLAEALSHVPVRSVYIGGGTPTAVPWLLYDAVRSTAEEFVLTSDCEVTVEVAPEGDAADLPHRLRDLGVTRISIGVQALNDDVLRTMRRRHDSRDALRWVREFREAGFCNLNVDVIPGFPGFATVELERTLRILADEGVPGVTLYDFETRREIPLYKEGRPEFRTPECALRDRAQGRNVLSDLGYEEFLCCWFRKEDSVDFRQQEHKWQGLPYFGLGVSAYGFSGQATLFHTKDMAEYFRSISTDEPLLAIELSKQQIAVRRIYYGLRMPEGIDIRDSVLPAYECFWSTEEGEALARLVDLTLVEEHQSGAFRLTAPGLLVSDEIAELFERIASRVYGQERGQLPRFY